MKLTLKDFGPIDEFTLDLTKDIQFIYGENSVGKSYAVFVLYAVTKAFESLKEDGLLDDISNTFITESDRFYESNRIPDKSKFHNYQEDIQSLAMKAEGKPVNINQYIERSFKILLTQTTKSLEKILLTKFSSLSLFSNAKTENNFYISLISDELTLRFTPHEDSLELYVELSKEWKLSYDKVKNEFVEYYNGEHGSPFSTKSYMKAWQSEMIRNIVLYSNIKTHLQKTYLVPANRTGIYLSTNSFAPVIAELSVNRAFLEHNTSIELSTFSKDIADYIVNFSQMNSRNSARALTPFISNVEKNILKGKIEFDDQRKRITYHPDETNLTLDLAHASSMIAEISIIVAFFKYTIKDNFNIQNKINNTVIIEEPESHLHPKTQVALIELFTELPKYGIKLIITSHSDFMMDKLSNMIIEGKVDAETVGSYRMVMGEKGSYDVGDMKATKDGIPDKNFVEISEKLYEERVDIYDQLNEQNAATEYNKK